MPKKVNEILQPKPSMRLSSPMFVLCTLPLLASPLAAQNDSRLLPGTRYFEDLIADPTEPRSGIGMIITNLLEGYGRERPAFSIPDAEDAQTDWQASVAVGGTISLLQLAESPDGGIVITGQVAVFARFRVEEPSRDDLGQDWIVAMPIEMRHDDFSARVRISHHSSHLGDEFIAATGAERIEFGCEAIDALAAYDFASHARVYGGGSLIFRSNTRILPLLVENGTHDRFALQLGVDGAWQPFADPRVHVTAGIDWKSAERIRWKNALALTSGITLRTAHNEFGLVARVYRGRSALGQFFNTPETYWSLELIADL